MTDEADRAGKSDKKPKTRRVGQVLERGPNKWLIRIFIGYKPNGQNDYFNKTFHGAKTEAENGRAPLRRRAAQESETDWKVTASGRYTGSSDAKIRRGATAVCIRTGVSPTTMRPAARSFLPAISSRSRWEAGVMS